MTGPTLPMLSGYVDVVESCNELYSQSLDLVPQTYGYAGPYWSDKRNQAGGVLGTIYPPMYMLWGLSVVSHYQQDQRVADVSARLAAVRPASAAQQCFVR